MTENIVPISVVAKALGMAPQGVRIAIKNNSLPIGFVTVGSTGKIRCHVSAMKLYEHTGIKLEGYKYDE